jgi:hypothetical protein
MIGQKNLFVNGNTFYLERFVQPLEFTRPQICITRKKNYGAAFLESILRINHNHVLPCIPQFYAGITVSYTVNIIKQLSAVADMLKPSFFKFISKSCTFIHWVVHFLHN